MRHRLLLALPIIAVLVLLGIITLSCPSAFFRWGLVVGECPVGEPRAEIEVTARQHRDSDEWHLMVSAQQTWITAQGHQRWAPLHSYDAQLSLE